MKITHILIMAAMAASGSVSAQVSASQERFSPLAEGQLERARIMLTEKNYLGAIDQINMAEGFHTLIDEDQRREAAYILGMAAYERGTENCIDLLGEFEKRYPDSPLALGVRLTMGDFYFFEHRWGEALDIYSSVSPTRLNPDRRALYTYRSMLCAVKTGNYDLGRAYLYKIAGIPGYKNAFLFYDAYLDYVAGDYSKAYSGFSKVPSGIHGLEAGYYMTQIEYIRGQYSDVIEHGRSLLQRNPVAELAAEINRIVGLSYFKEGNYSVARTYLEASVSPYNGETPADVVYALGVCDYNEGNYEKCMERMDSLTPLNNALSQSAWLYYGQSAVTLGNRNAALPAFEKAVKMGFDRKVSEIAHYNYVAAILDGGSMPFASSVGMLEDFLAAYPSSQYAPKVEQRLATAYYNERNYSKALKSINAIAHPSGEVLSAKQKILYQLGVESLTNGNAAGAAKYFTEAINLKKYNADIALESRLWLGDARYSLGEYAKAASEYQSFVKGSKGGANRTLAMYNLAYARYMQERYSEAAADFRTALAASPALPASLKSDARLRLADCLYYTGNYAEARGYYAQATADVTDGDYAAYRHAVMTGLSGNVEEKLKELRAFELKYPDSRWIADVLLEKALTYQSLNRNREAEETFRKLSQTHPESGQARKALLNLALQQSRTGKKGESAMTYREIITRWPSSEEARIAHDDLRSYYASTGQLAEYSAFLDGVEGAPTLDVAEIERLAFDSAEEAYVRDQKNIRLLENYVTNYPDGQYLAAALFDLANGYEASDRNAKAVECLTTLIEKRPHSAQYAEALLLKAGILERSFPNSRDEACRTYMQLERSGSQDFLPTAYMGIARTVSDPAISSRYARMARNSGGLSAEEAGEAGLIEADALLKQGKDNEAVSIYKELTATPSAIAGAKAAVELGQYFLNKRKYKEAEEILTDFTDQGTPHQYWLARGFIALADAYKGQGKTALAREYLTGLRSNYPGKEKDILNMISTRLSTWK